MPQDLLLRLSSCGTQAYLPQGMWNLPEPGTEPVSPYWQVHSYVLDHQGSPDSKPFVFALFDYQIYIL